MSFRRPALIASLFLTALLLWLQGCAQETPEPTGPITGGKHSDVTVSGYMRTGVTTPAR
jgi:hypothetical protein